MKLDPRILIGVAVGLVTVALLPPRRPEPVQRILLSDCEGALQDVVLHYVPGAAEKVVPVYRDFLAALPESVRVHVVVPDQAAWQDLRYRLPDATENVQPVLAGHPITAWSRDRWLSLRVADAAAPHLLLTPFEEALASSWPARAGDARVAGDLARALQGQLSTQRSQLLFDGGDFVADNETAFVSPNVLDRNLGNVCKDEAELVERLEALLGKTVVTLPDAPRHHAGMVLMPIGRRRVLVGDPRWGCRLVSGLGAVLGEVSIDDSPRAQKMFDHVARRCREAGYQVLRIPVVPGSDGRTYLTYVNAVLGRHDGRDVAWVPVFSHVSALNAAALQVWREAGYVPRPVDCTSVYPHFGSLRCLVNVLRRNPS